MSKGISTAHSVVEPTARTRWFAGILVALYAFVTIVPLAWIILTGFKTPSDAISYPPKVVFTPSIDGYCNLFTTRSRQTPEYIASLPPAQSACEQKARDANMVVAGKSNYVPRFVNSLIIAFGSTISLASKCPSKTICFSSFFRLA
jgi:multiple sugar transport system permease protein